MSSQETMSDTMDLVWPLLQTTGPEDKPVVLMTCGIAGSGKTTFAKQVMSICPSFTRLSMDEMIFAKYGLYGKDYPADEMLFESYLAEIGDVYDKTFGELLQAGHDIILERSFYARADRDGFKKMIEEAGARWVLIYFKAMDKELLWGRICSRSLGEKTANSAFVITRERFDRYWHGFQGPDGEGEITVEVAIASEGMSG